MVLLVLVCWRSLGADQTYYRNLQFFLATNSQVWEVRAPSFVDTNNTGFKLTNVVVNLASLRKTGTVGGVRPGMTMEEVIACWGKPLELWAKGLGGPRFCYKEVSVFFEPARNSVKSVYTQDLPSLMRKLEITPKVQECLNALGNPTFRDDTAAGDKTFFDYETPQARLKIGCVRGKLASIQLESPE